ncbi:MAG: class I SAM-dependent RNA methyltransferase [Candidatus Delongbacteria bacterium]|nr:class I SAM-dependent RNA methyltransferase [Candidatus Delongbacteria bacterium]MBN2833728.1 class I SAM-dependent RNA methyltransferase [Candidatus Delongbacteria bacterium]
MKNRFKKNEILRCFQSKMNENFEGYYDLDGNKIIVQGLLDDEDAEIKIVKPGLKVSFGIIKDLIRKSPYRVSDKFNNNGELDHCDYDYEVKFKQILLSKLFDRDLKYISSELENYRNKVFLPSKIVNDELQIGLYKRNSHEVLPYNFENSVVSVKMNDCLKFIVNILNEDLKFIKNSVKGIYLRGENCAFQAGILVSQLFSIDDRVLQKFINNGIDSLFAYLNDSGNSILVKDPYFFTEKDYSILKIKETDFKLRPESFFQLNSHIASKIVDKIKDYCRNLDFEIVYDLFAGVGFLSHFIEGSHRILFEITEGAFKYSKKDNTEFYYGDIDSTSISMNKNSLMIVDPPRKGVGDKCIDIIREFTPKHLIYLSCNPISLKNDLSKIDDLYDLVDITGFDMFPRTPHIETLTFLKRR